MPSRKRTACYWILGTILFLSALLSFWPSLVPVAWYVTHKHEASFRGLSLTVPLGWRPDFVDATSHEFTLRKPPLSTFQDKYYQTITFSSLPVTWDSKMPYSDRKQYMSLAFRSNDWSDVTQQSIAVNKIICTSGHPKEDSKMIHANCLVPGAGVLAEFNGASRDMPEFIAVLKGLH